MSALTKQQREAQEAAQAVVDAQDRAKRADALAEQRKQMTEGLRASIAPGGRRQNIDAADATPEQREAVEQRRKGLDQGQRSSGDAPALTQAERNALMNDGLRNTLFGRQEEGA
jgi:hypothetical protein